MVILELIPISTLLALLTQEILETAIAAQDVLVEKETFKLLTACFMDIQPVLHELRMRNLAESQAVRQALDSLQEDISRAKRLVDMCTRKSRFYLLVHCRNIVKEAEQVTRDVVKSLTLLSTASTEVSVDIRNNVNKLKDQMLSAEFHASEQKLQVISKIEEGIGQHRTDQAFVNDLIREIARAVGVPAEDSEIRKELEKFKREKEEAAARKEREEEAFMEQIIALLLRADAACTPQDIREEYRQRRYTGSAKEEQPPLSSFLCPFTGEVMEDPVSVSIGHVYERVRIQEWFDKGEKTDFLEKVILTDFTLRPNHKIKEAIQEWLEMNYSIRIQNAKRNFESGNEAKVKRALWDLLSLCDASPKIKHWIAEEELVPPIVAMLHSPDKELKRASLLALHGIVTGNDDNKEQLVVAGGVEQVVRCLARDTNLSKPAVALLLESLHTGSQEKPCRNAVVYDKLSQKTGDKLSQKTGAIILLVTLINGQDAEAAKNAQQILDQLAEQEQNVVEMAKANWYSPLIERLSHGSDGSKLIMAKALADMELTELNKQTLGLGGAVPPLVKMISLKLEAKAAALKALQNLSSFEPNKRYIAEAGAVLLVLDHLLSGKFPVSLRESAAAIIENLVLDEGTKFLVDANGDVINLETTIQSLVMVQDSSSSSPSVRKHVLRSLLGLVSLPDSNEAREVLKKANGISMLLRLLESPDREIRDVVVQLVSCLSAGSAQEMSLFLMQKKKAGFFVGLLQDGTRDVQAAAANILANLPPEDTAVTRYLFDEKILPAIVNVLNSGSPISKESAAGALLQFTSLSNLDLQQKVVELDIFPILRGLVNSGTALAKVRAANAFRNFSIRTLQLSTPPSMSGCFWMLKRPPQVCRVHPGLCGEKTTFCLLEAGVVSDLVALLSDRESDAAGAGMEALSTLVLEEEILEKGANFLHEENAIAPILDLMSQGTESSKEKAIDLLARIFKIKRMVTYYSVRAKIPLVELATNESIHIRKKAAKVLGQLHVIPDVSTYF